MKKVALVTGASSGMGEAVARQLAKDGFVVYGTSRSPRENRDGIRFLVMDVDEEASVRKGVHTIIEEENRIDVVVNAAGMGMNGALEEVPVDTAKRVFETNLFGMMRVIQATLPVMRNQRQGVIVNFSSIGGLVGLPFRAVYSASKHAVEGLSESLSLELSPFNIRVVLIEPGGFNTNVASYRPQPVELPDRPYGKYFDHVTAMVAHEVENAPGPAPVGKLVSRIVRRSNPVLRHPIGNFLEKLTPRLKRLLPWKLYALLIRRFHKL